MAPSATLDSLVRHKLRSWPQHPPGLKDHELGARGAWMRARPGNVDDIDHPYLKLPGTNRMKSIPDGLWLCFGGSERDPFVDIFGIM